MRAPNEMQTFFALESAMDELAIKLGMDPVELRRVNDTDRHPVADVPFSSRSLMACYDAAAKSFGWAGRSAAPGSMTDGDWRVGYGCATSTYPTAVAPSAARIRMYGNGHAVVELAAHDVGTGAYTIMGQIAAAQLGLPVDAVEVLMGDSNLPLAPISGGSVTSASAGSAVHLACINLAAEIARTVSRIKDTPLSGIDPANVTLDNGMLKAGGGQNMSLLEALKATPRGEAAATGEYAHPDLTEQALRTTYKGGYGVAGPVTKSHAMFAFGAQFVEVRIHRWTREIRVPRIHGAFAAGNILNRKTAHSQLMGGMIWGISSALHEHTLVDHARARFLNTDIAEYLVPVNADIREVRVAMLGERDDYVNPLGVKGIGELGIVGTAAALDHGKYDLAAEKPEHFALVVFYRGLHCPICTKYLLELGRLLPEFGKRGVSVVAISSDTQERARAMADKLSAPDLRMGYDFTLASAREWGLSISTSRGLTSIGVEEPALFAEPGVFIMRPDGTLYYAAVQTMPFARPHFDELIGALDFAIAKNYPARGEYVGEV